MHGNDLPILVVGGGVIGASVAYHLAREGHRVTVLERGDIAGEVSGSSFAWLGFAKSSAEVAAQGLRREADAEFRRLEAELGTSIGVQRGGAITWESSEAETRAFVDQHRTHGHPIELITNEEILHREPQLREAPSVAAFSPGDAGVDPVVFTRALLQGAIEHGANVHTHTPVRGLLTENGAVCGVATDEGHLWGSGVVLAAGVGINALMHSLDLVPAMTHVTASPCCLLRFSTPAPLITGIVSSPDFEIRQLDRTTLIAAEDVPLGFAGDARTLAAPTLAAIRRLLIGGETVELIDAVVAERPIAAEGTPLLGFHSAIPGLYLASAHPAFILAGAIGATVARDFVAARHR